jgi:hypothetical protein
VHIGGLRDSLWTDLGLQGLRISALAYTPWGLYAGVDHQGVFRSDSGGGKWARVGLENFTVSSLVFVPGHHPRVLAGVRTRAPVPSGEPGLFASPNSGRTWEPSDAGLQTASVLGLAADPAHPNRVYMRSSRGLLRSGDGGRTWRYAPIGGSGAVHALLVSPWGDGRLWYAASNSLEGARVGRSEDQGETWHHYPAPSLSVLVADPIDPERLWADGGNHLARSDDAGRTWAAHGLPLGTGQTINSLLFIGRTMYVSARGELSWSGDQETNAIYQSQDFGQPWRAIALPAGVREVRTLAADPNGDLVIGSDAGIWRLNPSGTARRVQAQEPAHGQASRGASREFDFP